MGINWSINPTKVLNYSIKPPKLQNPLIWHQTRLYPASCLWYTICKLQTAEHSGQIQIYFHTKPGSLCLAQWARHTVPDTVCQAQCARHSVPGSVCLAQCAWLSVPGTVCLALGRYRSTSPRICDWHTATGRSRGCQLWLPWYHRADSKNYCKEGLFALKILYKRNI